MLAPSFVKPGTTIHMQSENGASRERSSRPLS